MFTTEYQSDAPVISTAIIDGAIIVQMLNPTAVKNFDEYASQIFIPYILLQCQNATCVDLYGIDTYMENSTLKSTARVNCGKGMCRHVASETPIPGNW